MVLPLRSPFFINFSGVQFDTINRLDADLLCGDLQLDVAGHVTMFSEREPAHVEFCDSTSVRFRHREPVEVTESRVMMKRDELLRKPVSSSPPPLAAQNEGRV